LRESNKISHTWLMARVPPPWAPPLVELSVGVTGHLLCWERSRPMAPAGLGVLGARVRRPGATQGGPGPRGYPAPAGAARRIQRRATADARPGRADPGCELSGS